MADIAFEVGQTVRLKSGGPLMTVSSVGDDYGVPTVWCVWFDKTTEKTGKYVPGVLEAATAKPPPTVYSGRSVRG